MQISKFKGVAAAGLGCVLGAQFTPVCAAGLSHSDSGAESLDEIVVTATKRAENLQTVPFTVSVVSEADLQSHGFVDTEDLTHVIPDLQYHHSDTPGNEAFGIRGVSTLGIGPGLEQSAGVAFDGVPLGRVVGSIADLVDIHSVEVLKGPQGMLFGKNASAGLMNIISNTPELDKTTTDVRASFGSLNLRQYSGTVNLPITPESALRVTAWKFSHDGTVHEVNTGQDMNDKNSSGARLKYRWRVSDDFDLNLTAEWTSHDANGTAFTIRSFDPANFTPFNAGALVQAWELAHGTSPSDTNRTARGIDAPYYDKGHTAAYTAQGDYAIGDGTLTAIAAYRSIYNDNPFDPWPTDNPYNQQAINRDTIKYDQVSEELRYLSPLKDRLHYVVGLFNFRMHLRDDLAISFSPPYFADNFDTGLTNDNYAAFGEATFDLTPQLHLIAGVRRSTDKDYVSMDRTYLSSFPLVPGYTTGPDAPFGPYATSVETTYNNISYRAGLQYQFLPDAMLYATASRGYKGPGVGYQLSTTAASLALSNNGVIKPEIAHSYEVGLKTAWFDRRLTVNVAGYQEIFDDFQTTIVLPGAGFVTVIENAPQLQSTGLDLDASLAVTRNFNLLASVTSDNVRYTKFSNASCYSGQTQAQGCINNVQDLTGHPLPNTPKTTTNLGARYEHLLGAQFRGFIQANHAYRSAVNFSSTGDPAAVQGGYGVVNVTTGINTTDGRWGVSIYGNNVFDKHYVDYFASTGGGFMYLNQINYADLQTFGIAVNARF